MFITWCDNLLLKEVFYPDLFDDMILFLKVVLVIFLIEEGAVVAAQVVLSELPFQKPNGSI